MRAEDEALQQKYLKEKVSTEKARMEEEAKELREREIDESWKKYLLDSEIERQQMIQQLTEAAQIRGQRGKKRKKRGGKKKKGK